MGLRAVTKGKTVNIERTDACKPVSIKFIFSIYYGVQINQTKSTHVLLI